MSATPARALHARRLSQAMVIIGVFFLVEVIAGLATRSLVLLADAGHLLADLVGIGIAAAAMHLANRETTHPQRTFGLYRLEIVAALANAILLLGVGGYVIVEAASRFGQPPSVPGPPVLLVAAVGLGANLVVFRLLHHGAHGNLNVRGAYLEVLADTVASIGAMAAAATITLTGWHIVDPIAGVAVGLFIIPRTLGLARQALRIVLQTAPAHVDVAAVHADLAALPGVVDVHDLHLWTLSSDMEVASAHLMVHERANTHAVLDQAREVLRTRYRLPHTTFQVEPDDHVGCKDVDWCPRC